ncbi:MAG: hypothetical protein JWQ74_3586, partial [Marmoricola sp.]|nr:hypothetical protein [Marmoricola sp.]
VKLRLVGQQEVSGLGSGQIYVVDLAPKYWEAEVNFINMENADARKIQGIIESLDEGMNDFYWFDPRSEYPIADPTGSILGASNPKIDALRNNNKELGIKSLPNGYVLSAGDFLSFDFGSAPVHRAFHRIVEGGVATGGTTGWLEVRPHIRPGAAVNADVTLKRASMQMKMIPGSFDPGTARQMMTTGMSFKARQVI